MTSFEELRRVEEVAGTQLKSVLNYCAESGAPISWRVVVAILNRTPLTSNDRAQLLESAKRGFETHQKMQKPEEAAEYQKVVERLEYVMGHIYSTTPSVSVI